MTKTCSIIMYHYVRELPLTRFPRIKGLLLSEFKGQLDYLQKYYEFVTMQDCINAVYNNGDLPENAVLLTFDDAYLDHFTNVFPILDERGIQGSFFPSAKPIVKGQMLDVNKIHFILAATEDIGQLLNDIYAMLDEYRGIYNLESNEHYASKFLFDDRFDAKEVTLVKRLLQVELNPDLRKIMTDQLFEKYVTSDEASFLRELYMSEEQLKCIVRQGMFIGGHGFDHAWLNKLSYHERAREIDLTLDFLQRLGVSTENWVMNYPYGQYDEDLSMLLKEKRCALALTTDIGIAQLTKKNAYTLERLDTNHIPKQSGAEPNEWTKNIKNTIAGGI